MTVSSIDNREIFTFYKVSRMLLSPWVTGSIQLWQNAAKLLLFSFQLNWEMELDITAMLPKITTLSFKEQMFPDGKCL